MNTYTLIGQKGKWVSETKANISKIYKEGGQVMKEDNKDEYMPTPMYEGNPAYINLTGGVTRNTGDFNSVKISISLTYPCNPDDIDKSYEKIKNWVDKRLSDEIAELG